MVPGARVDTWMKQNKRTLADFVRAVRESFRARNEGRDPSGKPRSFDPQIRRWHDGVYDFGNHPDCDAIRQAIADVLDVELAVLFPRAEGHEPAQFPIESFSLLGPFDARHDDPCFTSALVIRHTGGPMAVTDGFQPLPRFDWLRPRHRSAAWVHTPPGAGRSFVAHWHSHRWKHHAWDPNNPSALPPSVHVVDKLEDLNAHRWPPETQRMVVEVREAGGDDGVLMPLRERRAIVLAPFECPRATTVDGYPAGWMRVEWSPDLPWRHDYVRWVSSRLQKIGLEHDSLLDEQAFVKWIDEVDPRCRLFDTPEALLGLLEFVHGHGEAALARSFGPDLARTILTAQLARHQEDSARGQWLREFATSVVERMLAAGWRHAQLSWGRALLGEQWASLVPADAVGGVDGGREEARDLRAKLKHKVSAAERKKLELRLDEVLAQPPSASEVVGAFRQARLLRPCGIGALQFVPGWIADAAARGATEGMIQNDEPEVWGRLAVDPTRRSVVDTVLTNLPWEGLARVATRAARAHHARSTLGTMGALEAVFAAVGAKVCAVDLPVALREVFADVAAQQVGLLAPHYTNGLPAPRTRPGASETGGASFLAACWAWSFVLPRPDFHLSEGAVWLFPGWARPTLDRLPDAFNHHEGRSPRGPLADVEEDGIHRLAGLAPFVLDACPGSLPEHRTPWYFAVAAIARATRRDWDFAPLVRSLPRRRHVFARLERELRALSDDLRTETISGIWRALLSEHALPEDLLLGLTSPGEVAAYNGRLLDWDDVLSPLDAMLRANLPLVALQERIRTHPHWDEGGVELLLARAPRNVRNDLARTFLDLPTPAGVLSPGVAGVARAALQRPDEMFDVLVTIADDPHHAYSVVPLLWRTRPELVRLRAEARWREHGATERWIFWGCDEAIESVLAVFEAVPERPLTPELTSLLSRKLPEVGALADRVWNLLEREQRRGSA
jgi:hypothetical protein